jgi:hypothetical protein
VPAALLFASTTCALAALTGVLVKEGAWRWASVCLSLLLAPLGALTRWQLSWLNVLPARTSSPVLNQQPGHVVLAALSEIETAMHACGEVDVIFSNLGTQYMSVRTEYKSNKTADREAVTVADDNGVIHIVTGNG